MVYKKVGVVLIIIVFLILVFVFRSSDNGKIDFIFILENYDDYNQYKKDFMDSTGKEFEPEIVEFFLLDEVSKHEQINEWEQDTSTRPFTVVFENLDITEDLYYVEVFDISNKNRGFMSVIDAENNEVERFIAILKIKSGN